MARRLPGSSPERTEPSAADVVGPPTAARPEHDNAAGTASLVVSQAHEEKLTMVGDAAVAAGVMGEHQEEGPLAHQEEGPLAHQNTQEADAEAVVAEAAAKLQLQITDPVIDRFAPVKDVKSMLQTGLFEGKRIVYKNKKDKNDILHGIIKGTSYFCLCGGYCDKTGKELSAKSFELHAKGEGHESHNPNDHIFLQNSTISLFETSKKLKEARNASMLTTIFKSIVQKGDSDECSKKNTTGNDMPEDYSSIQKRLELIEKRIEKAEKKMEQIEQIQSQVNTLEQNVEFLVNQAVRYQNLFEELSKVFGKFKDI